MDGYSSWRDNVSVKRLVVLDQVEGVYLHTYRADSQALTSLARHIAFYKTRWLHSSLDKSTSRSSTSQR